MKHMVCMYIYIYCINVYIVYIIILLLQTTFDMLRSTNQKKSTVWCETVQVVTEVRTATDMTPSPWPRKVLAFSYEKRANFAKSPFIIL